MPDAQMPDASSHAPETAALRGAGAHEPDDPERLTVAQACHDDDPARAAALLRTIDPTRLAPERWPLLAFLFNHVLGEKLADWNEAAQRQRQLLAAAAPAPATALWRHAAMAARIAASRPNAIGPETARPSAAELSAAFAESAAAPPELCEDVLEFGIASLCAPTLDAEAAAQRVRAAVARFDAPRWQASGPLDATVAAGANNVAGGLLERPAPDLQHPALRTALIEAATLAHRFWRRAGTWVNHERALYLLAMAHNAIGEAREAHAHAIDALALLDRHDTTQAEFVDRAFIELERWHACRRLALADDAARARSAAQQLAERFGDDGLQRWFDGRVRALDALAN